MALDAQCNIVYNALTGTWHAGETRCVLLGGRGRRDPHRLLPELYAEVNRFANALKSLGITKGDRVVIYLPRIIEQVVAMLAVARIGAVHPRSSVLTARPWPAHRGRPGQGGDLRRRLPVRGQAGREEGRSDEAIKGTTVEGIVVRRVASTPMQEGGTTGTTSWWPGRPYVPANPSRRKTCLYPVHPGTTGKPKGVVHVHGGYMVQVY